MAQLIAVSNNFKVHRPFMIADSLRSLINYHEWATQRILGACMEVSEGDYRRDLGLDQGSIHDTLNYQLNIERRWMGSYLNDSSDAAEMMIKGRDSLAAALRGQCRKWRKVAAEINSTNLDQAVSIVGTTGIKCELTNAEVLFEVINFGVLQRGKLTYAVTWLGVPDPETDFVSYRSSP
ncbi:hypothetical protein LMG33810_000790 [Carnimonas sp. LMG 33810]